MLMGLLGRLEDAIDDCVEQVQWIAGLTWYWICFFCSSAQRYSISSYIKKLEKGCAFESTCHKALNLNKGIHIKE
jgi:hypothetical protein